MAFAEVTSLDTDTTVTVGGLNKKTGKPNQTKIEGYYLGTRGDIPNKYNPSKPNCIHVLQTAQGNVGVWGKTNLDKKMGGVTAGCMIRITFTGTQPTNKGNDMLCYKVEVDKENRIDVDAPNPDATAYDASAGDDDLNESDLDSDEQDAFVPEPTPPPVQARAPRQPAAVPNTTSQAAVQALLAGRTAKRG